jgi:hypothetical protein
VSESTVSTTTTTPSSTQPSLATDVNTSPITIPLPFDTAQLADTGSNFTSSACPQFMRSFLNATAFQECVPFSLLLYTSSAFFSLTRSVSHSSMVLIQGSFAITQVLDAACNASPKTCGAIMDAIAAELVQDHNCGPDIKAQNPLALQALTGSPLDIISHFRSTKLLPLLWCGVYQRQCHRSLLYLLNFPG